MFVVVSVDFLSLCPSLRVEQLCYNWSDLVKYDVGNLS